MLVRALARIAHLPWECDCAGSLERDPDHAARVLADVESRGLADRVRFAGECDEAALAAFYAESAVFVLASHYEGYGMVLAEALAHGLPIVSTTGGAIPETVPAEAAVLVAPGDDAALAAALAPLLAGPGGDGAGRSSAGESSVGESGAGRSGAGRSGAGRSGAGRSGAGRSGAGRSGAGRSGAGRSGAERRAVLAAAARRHAAALPGWDDAAAAFADALTALARPGDWSGAVGRSASR